MAKAGKKSTTETFAPKYVPYREAARIVAERVGGLKAGQINPLELACRDGAILPEVCDVWRRNWRQVQPGSWDRMDFYRGPAEARPPLDEGWGGGISLEADEARILMKEIDRLWPPEDASGGGADSSHSAKRARRLTPTEVIAREEFPPDGEPPAIMSTADALRRLEKRVQQHNKSAPDGLKIKVSDDTMRRAVGRR